MMDLVKILLMDVLSVMLITIILVLMLMMDHVLHQYLVVLIMAIV